MSNLLVSPKWNAFINKVDAGEEITGGDLGNANIATRQLAENVMFLRDSTFRLVADATGDLSQAMVESNKKTKDEFDIIAGLIEAQNEIIIAEAKARKEAISASNTKIAEEAAARLKELDVTSKALQKEIDDRKESFRLEHISRAESEAKFTEDLEEVLTEAVASVKKVENLSSQLIGGYDGSNLDFVTEGLLFQQKNVTSTALEAMAEQISMLSVGVGEQFDTAKIWHFDKNKEDWINGVFDIGYLLVKSETVTSPTFLIDGDIYHHIKMRINKVGDPDWAGNLVWNTGSIALPEAVFVDDVTSITLDTTWSGDITQLQLKLSTNADDTNYYKIDWITIGRPSPGASTASVLDLKIATATRDEALAQDIRGLSTKMDTNNALLSSNVNTKLETITTQQQTQATDITTLSSNVVTMNTKLSADIVEVNTTLVTKETALAESIAALTSKTNESEASVLTQLQTLTDIDSALGTQLDALSASFNTAAAGIVAQNLVFTAEDLAQATQISQLTTKVDGNIAEVNTQIETLTDAQSANANKFTSISAEFKALDDKTDASDAEIRVNAADIIEERNARATDVLAQATRIDVLTTEVGENAASATTRINLLSLEDKALAERLDVLTASTGDTKANINLRLTALADKDSAFSEQLTQVMAAVDDNDSAVHERVTALTTATDAEAEKLTLLSAEVGANSAEILTTSRTSATNAGAIAEFNTRLTVDYLPKVENIESNILNAVKQTDVQYYLSISDSRPLGGEWLTAAPTWEPSKYMFQRMETTYVDGKVKYTPGENGTNISGAKGDKGLDGKDGSDGVAGLQGVDGKDGLKGPAGKDGESSYTHLAYATSKNGAGFSTAYFETATYIGMYVDNIKEDSENYALYKWSLIKGADGTNGIPGPKGTDGKTSYLHIAYANSPDGAEGFSTTASIGKTYIGQYTDFKLKDSDSYTLYSWTLIKGEKGDQGPAGLTGLEGPKGDKGIQGPPGPRGPIGPEGLRGLTGLEGLQGDQGIPGEKGEDGLSSYTHIAYATSVTGTNFNTGHFAAATYIGMYVDSEKTDSAVPSKYRWSLIKGADGANGIAGPKGTDGKTSYLHIAYANNVTGNIGFSTTVSEGKTHIGQYTDFELADSPLYTKYKWTLIKGDKGDTGPAGLPGVPGIEGKAGATGIRGIKGADGTSSYTHLAYATSVTGTNFNTTWYPTATYIGMYVDRTEVDSIVPSKYNWSLIKGADGANGIEGPKGDDGKTTYLHIAYANSEDGDVGFSTTVSAGKAYIGQYTDTTLGDSEDYTIYSWSLIKGADGLSSYAHLAYATSATGTNFNTNHFQGATYIGMYVDNTETDSKVYTKYNWSLIKGADGANGIPGPTGEDGKTSYLHFAYATSATGAVGFSTTVSAGKTYIGQYTDFELVDSPSYTKYKWSLIKGDKGDTGPQGPIGLTGVRGLEGPKGATGLKGDKGANGLSSYTHLAYATSATGLDFSTGYFEGATYIGMYVDNTETDSTVYTKYNWSLIKGADGDKGIAGPKGTDGKTAYLHIAYATSATGNTGFSTTVSAGKTYIGQYTDNELVDSPTYTRYKWSLIKGDKGDQGIQGPIGLTGVRGLEGPKGDTGLKGDVGADGTSSYTHLAYATSAAGALFSTSWYSTATYIGMYVDNIATDSTVPSKYKWSLIKGADGANGIAGPKGTDGKTAYLHIAYATSANGATGFSTTISDGKTYIGQYTDNELVDSPTYTKYKWTLIKGETGEKGATGNTGATGSVGQGVDTITEQYAVSTSKTVVPTTWTTVMPVWSYGLYVWSRSMIKYKNPVATEYTTPIVDSSWEAVNNLEVGGRNLFSLATCVDGHLSKGVHIGSSAVHQTDERYIKIRNDLPIIFQSWNINKVTLTNTNRAAFYTASKVYISEIQTPRLAGTEYEKVTAQVPSNAAYIRIGFLISDGVYVKAEQGNVATDWTPAPEDVSEAIQGSLDIGNKITKEFGTLKAETKVLTEIGGKISGWKNLNNGATSSFEILADKFSVSTSTVNIKPFTIVGNDITFNGKVSFNSVTGSISSAQIPAGTINLNQLTTADKNKIDTASSTAATALSNAGTAQNRANQAFTQAGTAETNAKKYADTQATAAKNAAIDWSKVKDTRSVNNTPSWYYTNYSLDTAKEFKSLSTIGLSAGGSYCYVETIVKWNDSSGGAVTQNAYTDDNRMFTRAGTAATWSAWVESESSAGAQKKADAAAVIAKNYADLNDKIVVIDSKTKKFLNPSSYSSASASHTGYLIIETPIQSGRMVSIDITGYNYQANKASIALSVSFYITGTTFSNFDYVDTGTYPIENVRLGLKGGVAVIIVGNATSTWAYPKIDVTQAIIGYTASPDTYKDGWVTRIANVITDITNVVVMNNTYSTSLKGIYTNVYYPATTEIDGGNIRTKTIKADSIAVNTITAGQIAANTITGNNLVADTITTREIKVANLSAISANMGTITSGSIKIGSNFNVTTAGVLTASSGNFTGVVNATSGTFKGNVTSSTITSSSINIGGKFKVDTAGNMTATSGTFGGDIQASQIKNIKSLSSLSANIGTLTTSDSRGTFTYEGSKIVLRDKSGRILIEMGLL